MDVFTAADPRGIITLVILVAALASGAGHLLTSWDARRHQSRVASRLHRLTETPLHPSTAAWVAAERAGRAGRAA